MSRGAYERLKRMAEMKSKDAVKLSLIAVSAENATLSGKYIPAVAMKEVSLLQKADAGTALDATVVGAHDFGKTSLSLCHNRPYIHSSCLINTYTLFQYITYPMDIHSMNSFILKHPITLLHHASSFVIGIFAELDEYGVEGLVPASKLPDKLPAGTIQASYPAGTSVKVRKWIFMWLLTYPVHALH